MFRPLLHSFRNGGTKFCAFFSGERYPPLAPPRGEEIWYVTPLNPPRWDLFWLNPALAAGFSFLQGRGNIPSPEPPPPLRLKPPSNSPLGENRKGKKKNIFKKRLGGVPPKPPFPAFGSLLVSISMLCLTLLFV